jgi:hypothetical protein
MHSVHAVQISTYSKSLSVCVWRKCGLSTQPSGTCIPMALAFQCESLNWVALAFQWHLQSSMSTVWKFKLSGTCIPVALAIQWHMQSSMSTVWKFKLSVTCIPVALAIQWHMQSSMSTAWRFKLSGTCISVALAIHWHMQSSMSAVYTFKIFYQKHPFCLRVGLSTEYSGTCILARGHSLHAVQILTQTLPVCAYRKFGLNAEYSGTCTAVWRTTSCTFLR